MIIFLTKTEKKMVEISKQICTLNRKIDRCEHQILIAKINDDVNAKVYATFEINSYIEQREELMETLKKL